MIYELAKSMLSFTWDLSVSGADRMLNTLSPIEPSQMSRAIMTIAPRRMTKMMTSLLHQSSGMLRDWVPIHDSRLAWQEFTNKIQAFDTFEHMDILLGLPSESNTPLLELVERTEALGPYFSIWATEGLGRYYAEQHWEQKQTPQALLKSHSVSSLPDWSLIPLHTGMGLSLAERVLNTLPDSSSAMDINAMLRQFITLCYANSREGYTAATIEALGLVTRLLYPNLVQQIDQQLMRMDPASLGYFWHGVGRGIYFLPINAPPGIHVAPRAVQIAMSEATHIVGRLNALSGLVWALTLINITHPEILANVLLRHRDIFTTTDAFSNGVSSAILVWRDIKCDDPYLHAFCQYEPNLDDPNLVELWHHSVRLPCDLALSQYYEALKAENGFGELFRYQSLAELVEQLKSDNSGRTHYCHSC